MKTKLSLSVLVLSSILGIATGIGAYSLNQTSEDDVQGDASLRKEKSLQQSLSHSSGSVVQNECLQAANAALRLAEKGTPADAAEFLDHLVGLHLDDRDFILGSLHSHFFDDPDRYFEFVKAIAFLGYEREPAVGLDLISAFPREARICDVERHLLADWVSKDSASLFSLLEHRASAQLTINDTHLFQLTAIYGVEQAENFTHFLDWANSLTGEAGVNLQWACYQALSQVAPVSNRRWVYEETLKKSLADSRFNSFPANLIEQHTKDAPEEAQQWLETMSPGPAKDLSLSRFLSAAAKHHPQAGADLMNRETFLDEFAVGWLQTDEGEVISNESTAIPQEARQRFYDNALAHFLSSALNTDPELVLESAEAFYDEEHRVEFLSAAKDNMAGIPAIPDHSPSSHTCNSPNCQHHSH